MTKTIIVSMILVMSSGLLVADANQMQKYEVANGKVEYEIKGSGDIMGMKMKTIGKKRLIFTDYGVENLTEENKISKEEMNGKSKTTKTHTLTYMKNSIVYTVRFDAKRIMRMQNPAAAMSGLMGAGKNMEQTGKEMMKSMGGKKIGTDKVLGYTCDVWDLMGVKQCIYKGLPLKVESNIMGIKNTEIATKAEFDISLSNDDFKLPDFPIYDMEGNKLDKAKLGAMDKNDEAQAVKSTQEMIDLRRKMAESAQSAGVKQGQSPTKEQADAMMNSMMAGMLPMMKQKMLSQEKIIRFSKECISDADSLKDANVCNQKINEMDGDNEAEEALEEWNPQIKKEILRSIEGGLVAMECIKKAQTMDAAQQCMSEE